MKTKTCLMVAPLLGALPAFASVTLDGHILGDESYHHLTEQGSAVPVLGGQASQSDFHGETASNHWTDRGSGTTYNIGSDRGDIREFHISWDDQNLYLAVTGAAVTYNSWTGPTNDGNTNGDQGDLFIAIQTPASTGTALSATETIQFAGEGVRAVDFAGWKPNYMVGVQYVDNGGGGGGWAVLQQLGGAQLGGEAQGAANGGFDWQSNLASPGGYEFAIPWTALGYTGIPTSGEFYFAAYATQNWGGSDAYDSGPGIGNGGPFEQIGDFAGDSDSGLPGADTDNDGGSPIGTQPGANWVDMSGYSGPSNMDEVDTISEYWSYQFVPEPSSALLLMLAPLIAITRRQR